MDECKLTKKRGGFDFAEEWAEEWAEEAARMFMERIEDFRQDPREKLKEGIGRLYDLLCRRLPEMAKLPEYGGLDYNSASYHLDEIRVELKQNYGLHCVAKKSKEAYNLETITNFFRGLPEGTEIRFDCGGGRWFKLTVPCKPFTLRSKGLSVTFRHLGVVIEGFYNHPYLATRVTNLGGKNIHSGETSRPHPHCNTGGGPISDRLSSVCMGNALHAASAAAHRLDVANLYLLTMQVLTHYQARTAYQTLINFTDEKGIVCCGCGRWVGEGQIGIKSKACSECGRQFCIKCAEKKIYDDQQVGCYKCEEAGVKSAGCVCCSKWITSERSRLCGSCGKPVCPEHRVACRNCYRYICHECIVTCDVCGFSVGPECVVEDAKYAEVWMTVCAYCNKHNKNGVEAKWEERSKNIETWDIEATEATDTTETGTETRTNGGEP